ncbi:MAG: UbiA family prenyltransferase [Planctomycetota bacterium]
MIAYLRLLRVGLLLSPAADVTAGMALCGLPWTTDAVRALLASVCVYAAGMVLNDHADRALDAVQRPERPLPSGAIAPSVALTLGLGLLLGGCGLSPMPLYHGGLALLVLGYDYALKRHVATGAAAMGSLRALNLLSGGVVLGATPPQLLVYAALAYFVYIVAVTLMGVLEDEPRVKPRAVVSLGLVAPASACLALLQTPYAGLAAGSGAALLVALWLRALRRRSFDRGAIRRVMTFLLLGTMLYTALLCAGMGRFAEAATIFAAALLGRRITRSIAIT